ncbi:MAG TPA: beta-ketoacyl synthase N-terminal-like domain-containing protein [Ignavibacteriales bacterium]|nr:beta-ketoacyl synthase N-terminal-like domain-containing protein [Ignavibacteriales bacterium]
MKNRVAVTGLGVVSPLGIGIKETWGKITNNESAISDGSFEGCQLFPHSRCGSVPEFDPTDFIANRRILKLMNREAVLASAAARLAIDDARVEGFYKPESLGLFLGNGLTSGDLDYLLPLIENSIDEHGNFSYHLLGSKALPGCSPLLSFKILPNMALSFISILFNIKGRNMAFNPWPGNTAQAIGMAMRSIENGSVDCALAGGCDSKNHFTGFAAFSNYNLLSNKGICSPFSRESDGLILSEGASVVILENYERAKERGAEIYAVLSGYNTLTDSHGKEYFSSSSHTMVEVMNNTITDAALKPKDINAVIAGASSIRTSDMAEASAISNVFGNHLPLITGTKTLTGHMLAASPAFDVCIASYSFLNGGMPALLNNTDPDISLNFSSSTGDAETILVNSFHPGIAKAGFILRKDS